MRCARMSEHDRRPRSSVGQRCAKVRGGDDWMRSMSDDAAAVHHSEAPWMDLREELRQRVIRLGTMDWRLRLVVGAAVACLIVAAVFLALKNVVSPRMDAGTVGGRAVTVPVAVVVVTSLLLVTAWTLLISGAFHSHWLIRVTVFGFFAWSVLSQRDLANDVGVAGPFGIVLLAALLLVGVLTLRSDLRARPAPQARQWWPIRLLMVGIPVFGLYLLGWLSARPTGAAANYTNAIAGQLDTLTLVLIPLLVLAGAHFGDWAQFTSQRLVGFVARRGAWLTWGMAATVAAAVLADSIRVAARDFAHAAAPAVFLLVILLVLMLVGRPRGAWHSHLAFAALAGAAVIDSVIATLVYTTSANDPKVDSLAFGVSASFWAGAGVLATLALLAGRRRLPSIAVVMLVFVALVGATDVLGAVDSIAVTIPRLGIDPHSAPLLRLETVRGVAAAATIVLLLAALASGRVRQATRPIGLLLTLVVGMQILSWVDLLFETVGNATAELSVVAGVVLVTVLLWELVVSGKAVTNRHDHWASRAGRVLLYLGYILLVACSVLFFATLHTESGALHDALFDSEQFVHEGVLFLGLPLILALFVAGAGALFSSRRDAGVGVAD